MRKLLLGVIVLAVAGLSGSVHAQAPSCPSTGPSLFYPSDGATNVPRDPNNSVTVKWITVANTATYDVYFGPQGSGCNSAPRSTVAQGTTQFSPPAAEIFDGATYEWKVVAKGPAGCSTPKPSTCAKFTMIICPTGAPTLLSPANNASIAPGSTLLTWSAVPNAGFYELFISVDGQAPSLVATTTATQRTITTEPGHTISWAVRAAKAGCNGFVSQIFQFTTTCPTTPTTLSTPSDNATFTDTTSILFSWPGIDGASSYSLQRSSDGGQTWIFSAENISGRSFSTTFPVGNWKWRVRANFTGNCPALDSAPRSFTVISSSCNNAAPTLVAPADGSSHTLPVTLSWIAPSTAKKFMIFTSGPDGPKQIGETTATSLVVSQLDPGTYQWYVVAKFDNCPDVESSSRRTLIIKKVECPAAQINLTSPVNGAVVTSPVTLAWTGIANATAYRIWASNDGGAPVLLARTNNLSAAVQLPAGSFKWKVEGLRDDCDSVLSPEGNFVVQTAANCGSNVAPELLQPKIKDDPSTERKGNTIVLPWIAKSSATFYRVWVALAGEAFEDVGVTRDTQLERVLTAGKYRWFVQAFFENCTPLSSQTGEFTVEDTTPRCNSDKPIVAEPVNNSTVTKLHFRISQIDSSENRNVRYRFFAVIDRTNAEPEIVFLGASTTPEFEPALQLPPGTYQAFVEKSIDECPSTFSDRITFTIARAQHCSTAAPQLQSPSNGAQNVQPNVEFSWTFDGAAGTKFVLIVQVNDGAPTAVASTTETRITHRVPFGRIRWRVAAFPPGCDPTFSDLWVFGVELPQACSAVQPIGLQPDPVEEISDRGVLFAWTRVPLANRYNVWVWEEGDAPAKVASTTELKTFISLQAGFFFWFIEAEIPNCGSTHSAVGELTVIDGEECGTPGQPRAHVVGRTLSGSPYRVRWSALANVKTYELQQSASEDFANPETFLLTDTEYIATKTVLTGTIQYHYRVRGLSECSDEQGPYSDVVTVIIFAPLTNNASVQIDASGDIVQQLFIAGPETQSSFTITADKPWVKPSPSSGVIGPQGATITLTSARDQLQIGGNTATVKVAIEAQTSTGLKSNATSVSPFPINVSLVTPVTPGGKSGPSPDSLIFGAVGHAPGQNDSFFESDVRVVNLSAQTMKYQINYTPSGTDGTVTGNSTTVEIASNQTLALDDVVSSIFGLGTTSGSIGMLEVRPLTTTTSSGGFFSAISPTVQQLLTLGSSRTYNFTPAGSLGQFIPATQFSKFVGLGKILSLQQVAQSEAYRANFGFLEASGQPVDLLMRVYDIVGNLLATIPVSLQASEHKQIGLLLASNGITDLEDGRVELEVTSGGGKITAYVSEIDNATNDPYLVSAVEKGAVSTNRYVVPGMAHKDLGFAFWVSDLRIFNAGTTQVPATLTFYTEANPASFTTKQVVLDPGEIEVQNDVVQNLFGQPNGAGGSIVITTAQNAPLTVTARTYNKTTTGTYGQYIPGVTVAESVGAGDRALHILQVEHSPRLRTNIGLDETSGNPARVEVSLIQPDSIVTPVIAFDLAANEYRQFSVADFQQGESVYNARVTVKVISGTGKVTAYGSSIDMSTNDPTYITAQ